MEIQKKYVKILIQTLKILMQEEAGINEEMSKEQMS